MLPQWEEAVERTYSLWLCEKGLFSLQKRRRKGGLTAVFSYQSSYNFTAIFMWTCSWDFLGAAQGENEAQQT